MVHVNAFVKEYELDWKTRLLFFSSTDPNVEQAVHLTSLILFLSKNKQT